MIIAVFNQAGGVGKTTLTRDVGYELHTRGKRVLLVDADPQGTLGSFLGEAPNERPAADMFWTAVCDPDDESQPAVLASRFGPALGLSNRSLIAGEIALAQQQDPARLMSFLERLSPAYDAVLIDCPPRVSELTVQILFAADALLIPVQTEAKSVLSFSEVQVEIGKAQRRRRNMHLPALAVLGVVPTLYNPRYVLHRHHLREIEETVCAHLAYPLLAPVRDFIAVSEAGTHARPLKLYAPRCPVNADVAAVADALPLRRGRPQEAANG